MRKKLHHKKLIRSFELRTLLTACGGRRFDCEETLGAEVSMLVKKTIADPFFLCFHEHDLQGGCVFSTLPCSFLVRTGSQLV